MTVRPYLSTGRALRQIMRRHHNQLPTIPAARTPQNPAGTYRLSTRQPDGHPIE
ncbi:hypothetical protein ACFUTR_23425 [Streptomyces sp. NPDC057367]|uniref:hypothetical protein n=1 Tax=Streptomyces sp. NPDC057367 TaxID=3346108 RepID=UPI0036371DB0